MKRMHNSTDNEREASFLYFSTAGLGAGSQHLEPLESEVWRVTSPSGTAHLRMVWNEGPDLVECTAFPIRPVSERVLRLFQHFSEHCEAAPGAESSTGHDVISSCAWGAIPELRRGHALRDERCVLRFLGEHPELLPVLLEGRGRIPGFFGGDAKLELDVVMDLEADDYAQLFVYVVTSLAPDDILECFELFDREWFLDKMVVTGDLLCYSPVIR